MKYSYRCRENDRRGEFSSPLRGDHPAVVSELLREYPRSSAREFTESCIGACHTLKR